MGTSIRYSVPLGPPLCFPPRAKLKAGVAQIPEGFTSTLAVVCGRSAGEVLERWASALLARNGTERPPRNAGARSRRCLLVRVHVLTRAADAVTDRLSYWTDNGAAYWCACSAAVAVASERACAVCRYRKEKDKTTSETLCEKLEGEWARPSCLRARARASNVLCSLPVAGRRVAQSWGPLWIRGTGQLVLSPRGGA